MNRFILIAAGAALGANARYLVFLWSARLFGSSVHGTLAVNVAGSLVLGFLAVFSATRFRLPPEAFLFLATGFLGAFTTFSTFALDTVQLWQAAPPWAALRHLLLNNVLSIGAVVAGGTLARLL
jgi:CrcB protein